MHYAAARARAMASRGRTVAFARSNVAPAPPTTASVLAFLRAYQAGELQGGLQQGDARLETGTLAAPFAPPAKGDRVTIDGRAWTVLGAAPVSEGATLIGYSLTIRGG